MKYMFCFFWFRGCAASERHWWSLFIVNKKKNNKTHACNHPDEKHLGGCFSIQFLAVHLQKEARWLWMIGLKRTSWTNWRKLHSVWYITNARAVYSHVMTTKRKLEEAARGMCSQQSMTGCGDVLPVCGGETLRFLFHVCMCVVKGVAWPSTGTKRNEAHLMFLSPHQDLHKTQGFAPPSRQTLLQRCSVTTTLASTDF